LTIEDFLNELLVQSSISGESGRLEVKVKSTYWSRIYKRTMDADIRGIVFDEESKTLYIEFDKTSSK